MKTLQERELFELLDLSYELRARLQMLYGKPEEKAMHESFFAAKDELVSRINLLKSSQFKVEPGLTPQQCKEQIAKTYSYLDANMTKMKYESWDAFIGGASIQDTEDAIDEICELYTASLTSEIKDLKAENEQLRQRCSLNYGGGFTQEEVDLFSCRQLREKEQNEYTSEIKGLREAIEPLIEWNTKYPPGRIYGYDKAIGIERELTEAINNIKNALNTKNN